MTIHVELLDEGSPVSRPVEAIHINADVYQIVGENLDPEDEIWVFPPGTKVRCRRVILGYGTGTILLAYEEVSD